MQFEFSAGGIIFKKEQDDLFVLVCQHASHHHWGFPKGHIGDTIEGETKEAAALREVKEETGVSGEILQPLKPMTYWYQWEGEKRKKTVSYFVMRYLSGDITKHDFEMENVEWIPTSEVKKRLAFPSDKHAWLEAEQWITGHRDQL